MAESVFPLDQTDLSEAPPRRLMDAIIRVQQNRDADSDLTISYYSANSLRSRFSVWYESWRRSIEALSHVVIEQKKLLEYKDLCITHLSGLMDDTEFQQQASSYAIADRGDASDVGLADKVARLLFFTRLAFTAAEISDLFGVTMDAAEHALTLARRTGGQLGHSPPSRRLD